MRFWLKAVCLLAMSTSSSLQTTCKFHLTESEGDLSFNKTLIKQCSESVYFLSNHSNLLFADIDIKSPHTSRNCESALDKVYLPEGTEFCFQERMCKIYFNKHLRVSEIPSRFQKHIQRMCNVTWTELEKWPPRFKIKTHFFEFNAYINYRFLKVIDPKSRSINLSVPVKKPPTDFKIAAILPGVLGFLFIALIAGLIVYKRKKRGDPNEVYDIAPYAVHVSVRRRSENPFNHYNHPTSVRHYDVPPSADTENEYMHPMKECPYYEIDGYANSKAAPKQNHFDVYTMADPLPETRYDTPRTFKTFLSKSEAFLNSDSTGPGASTTRGQQLFSPQFNRYDWSRSEGDLIRSESFDSDEEPEVHYGEIIGVIDDEGKMQRFKPCTDTYKSIRKNH